MQAIRSPPAAHRPAEEESQQPAGEQADPKHHGEEGHHSPAHGLEESRCHEVVGSDQQQMMDQHADSMAGSTVPRGSSRVPTQTSATPKLADPSGRDDAATRDSALLTCGQWRVRTCCFATTDRDPSAPGWAFLPAVSTSANDMADTRSAWSLGSSWARCPTATTTCLSQCTESSPHPAW